MKAPKTLYKTNTTEYDLSQSVPLGKRDWHKHLCIVSALPHRYIGIVDEPIVPGVPFKMYATLLYIAELSFSPVVKMTRGPDGNPTPVMGSNNQPQILGIQGQTKLHVLVPYDFLGPATIEIHGAGSILWLRDQDEDFQRWAYTEYLSFFDKPKVAL